MFGAFFDEQETLKGYYEVFRQILTNYGIPNMFLPTEEQFLNIERKR